MTTLMSRIGQLVGSVIKEVSDRMLPNDTLVPRTLLPPATSTQTGAVKPGSGLSVAADGTLTVTASGAVSSVNGKTGAVTVGKSDIGLTNVDNTSDAAKPISTAMQTALDAKANASVTINAGTGLTGGGSLAANRTLSANIATQAEAEAGTLTTKLMTPQRSKQAFDAQLAARLASQALAEAGTDTASLMTPLATAQAIAARASSFAIGDVLLSARNPGAQWLPCSGLTYLQSGYPTLFNEVGLIENGIHDGRYWLPRSAGFGDAAISCVSYANGRWFVGGSGGMCASSTDALNWTSLDIKFGTNGRLRRIVHANGVYVAVGTDSTGESYKAGFISTSTDGVTWTSVTHSLTGPSSPGGFMDVTYFASRFVLCGWQGIVAYSSNGSAWTQVTAPNAYDLPFFWLGHNGSTLMMGCHFEYIYSSTNGTSWSQRWSLGSGQMNAMVVNNGLYVCVGSSGKIYTSTSPTSSWTQRTSNTTASLWSATYGNGRYVAVGDRTIVTSSDGITWTAYANAYGTNGYANAVGSDGSRFLLGGSSGVPSSYTGERLLASAAFAYDPNTEFLLPSLAAPTGLGYFARAQ